MVCLVAIIIWRRPVTIVAIGFLVFGSLDGLYLSSAATKVPDGAWFTLVLAILLSSIFVLWRFGKENQWRAEASDRIAPSHILSARSISPIHSGVTGNDSHEKTATLPAHKLHLAPAFGNASISTIPGMGIFFDKNGSSKSTPAVYIHFLQKFHASPAVVVFFHIRPLSAPSIAPENRFTISRCFPASGQGSSPALRDFFRVTLRHGYTDEVVTRDLGLLLYEQLRAFVIRESGASSPTATVSPTEATNHVEGGKGGSISFSTSSQSTPAPPASPTHQIQDQELARHLLASLQAAYTEQVVYIVGKEQMRVGDSPGGGRFSPRRWARRWALEAFLWLRGNTGQRVSNFNLEVEKLVEVGFVKVV